MIDSPLTWHLAAPIAAIVLAAGCAGSGSTAGAGVSPAASNAAAADTTGANCAADYPSEEVRAAWRSRVEAAQAMTDTAAQRDSMIRLVQEALGPSIEVRGAGNSVPSQTSPADYAPAPVVNFDIHLGAKRSSATSYYFTSGDTSYVVLGPESLNPAGQNRTQNMAHHELFHALNHFSDSRPVLDREVEVWTDIFVKTFHDAYPYKMLWTPLVTSYEGATPAEQQVALHRLVQYYRKGPQGAISVRCAAEVRFEYEEWLRRRMRDSTTASRKLIKDLQVAFDLKPLPADSVTSARAAVATQAAPARAAAPARPRPVVHKVWAGDLTGDKRAEVATWDGTSKRLAIWDYSGAAPREIASRELESYPTNVTIADVDGNGRGDLILSEGLASYNPATGPQTDITVRVYPSVGSGTWEFTEVFRAASERPSVTSLEVVNLDADPEKEILITYMSSKFQADLAVAHRSGIAWTVENQGRVRMGMHVAAGDVLRQQRPQLVVGRPYGDYGTPPEDTVPTGDAFVLQGTTRIALPVVRGVSSVAVGDVDGDRAADILVGDGWHRDFGKVARARLALVRRAQAKWNYDLIEDIPNAVRVEQIVLADLNQDRQQEVLVWASRRLMLEGYVRLYERTPRGWRGTTLSDSVQGFAVGDFAGNGRPQVIFAGPQPRMLALDLATIKWDAQLAEAVDTRKADPASLVGKPAPEIFATSWVGGKPVTLADLKGKVVLIDFWATWCKPCIEAFPTMREWQTRFGSDDFVILGMTNHSQQTTTDVRNFLAKRPLPWVVPIDSTNRTHLAYGTGNLPHQVLIDRQGIVHAFYTGAGETLDAVAQDIEKLIGQARP